MIIMKTLLLFVIFRTINVYHLCLFRPDTSQALPTIPQQPAIFASPNIKVDQQLSCYHPHYLHSYSYPRPSTPHIYYGRVDSQGKAIMLIRDGYQDYESNVYSINNHQISVSNKKIQQNGQLARALAIKTILVIAIEDSYNNSYVDSTSISVKKGKNVYSILVKNGTQYSKAYILFVTKDSNSIQIQKLNSEEIKLIPKNLGGQAKTNFRISRSIHIMAPNINSVQSTGFNIQFPKSLYTRIQVHLQQVALTSQISHKWVLSNYDLVLQRITNITEQKSCPDEAVIKLLQGLSYQYGDLKLVHDNFNIPNQPKSLLSFSPSRIRFPWGFLWDDGFHTEIIVRSDKKLALTIIKSWLNTMIDGWIPRQQNRGIEREQLCSCPLFLKKDDRDGNPPSLILPLFYLIKKGEITLEELEKGYWIKLKEWHGWYFKTQMTRPQSYLFKWFDHIKSNFPYNQISFNSGMDDFPRPLKSQYYVDTQAWMFYFTKFMHEASLVFNDTDANKYQDQKNKILINLQHFKQPGSNILKDVGQQPSNSFFGSSNPIYSQYVGYPSLLPLAFGMIEFNSPQYLATIELITNKSKLNTGYGLSSIQKRSPQYLQSQDSYWRGPIWINMNYLVLRGLKLYYPMEHQVYNNLRNAIIDNVCGNWERSGYFYENYSENRGTFSHPFNGWTSLIALIVSEQY